MTKILKVRFQENQKLKVQNLLIFENRFGIAPEGPLTLSHFLGFAEARFVMRMSDSGARLHLEGRPRPAGRRRSMVYR